MLIELRIQNFKSWADTGEMRLAPITGLFGANSSGKTSILQFLLLLKQTVENTDPSRVLYFGGERSLVDLRSFFDVIHQHETSNDLDFSFHWGGEGILDPNSIYFNAKIGLDEYQEPHNSALLLKLFKYTVKDFVFGVEKTSQKVIRDGNTISPRSYRFLTEGFARAPNLFPPEQPLYTSPGRFYGFPRDILPDAPRIIGNFIMLDDLVVKLEKLFERLFYLGPLREFPKPIYAWGGESLRDVGTRGEYAIPALLASKLQKNGTRGETVEEHVARWLKKMHLIHDFSLKPLGENRREYEVRIQQHPGSAEVLLTDVGFGVSQLLPVLVLCYYVPEGSILLLEQPEIHLHPSVQADLADVFIEVAKTRNLQIILESHSEHLLRRLQRRIAENEKISSDQTALYFCEMKEGVSQLMPLHLDEYGNINNWPRDFFGDEMGDLVALTDAAMKRMQAKGE